jgi:hypothetical protein
LNKINEENHQHIPVVFLTILDASEESLIEFQQYLEYTGLNQRYQFIVSSKHIYSLSKHEIKDMLESVTKDE